MLDQAFPISYPEGDMGHAKENSASCPGLWDILLHEEHAVARTFSHLLPFCTETGQGRYVGTFASAWPHASAGMRRGLV